MPPTAQTVFSTHQTNWMNRLKTDPSIEVLLCNTCDPLLRSGDPDRVAQGLELLLSFGESSMVRLLDADDSGFALKWAYLFHDVLLCDRAAQDMLGYSLCNKAAQDNLWADSWSAGHFDRMMLYHDDLRIAMRPGGTMRRRLLEMSRHLVAVPPGVFWMGGTSEQACADERPRHTVEIRRRIAIGKYPVSQLLYASIMGNNPSEEQGYMLPVSEVSWCDAVLFCNKLSALDDLEAVYTLPEGLVEACNNQSRQSDKAVDRLSTGVQINLHANGYRLPTEAEWEHACRGGKEHVYSGSDRLNDVGWYDPDGHQATDTVSVGLKQANDIGLHDMCGLVWEWCSDTWNATLYAERSTDRDVSAIDPHETNADVSVRVIRGGDVTSPADQCRASSRDFCVPSDRVGVGFRLVRTLHA